MSGKVKNQENTRGSLKNWDIHPMDDSNTKALDEHQQRMVTIPTSWPSDAHRQLPRPGAVCLHQEPGLKGVDNTVLHPGSKHFYFGGIRRIPDAKCVRAFWKIEGRRDDEDCNSLKYLWLFWSCRLPTCDMLLVIQHVQNVLFWVCR